MIGNQVRDRDIYLVTDTGDHRHSCISDRTCYSLVVERPQVFAATAASPDDEHVYLTKTTDSLNRSDNLRWCIHPLHRRGAHDEAHMRRTSANHRNHVAQRSTVGTRDHPDAHRSVWEGALASSRKQSVAIKAKPSLFHCLAPETVADCVHRGDVQMHFTASGIDGQLTVSRYLHALIRRRANPSLTARPDNTADLRRCIAQTEIPVPISVSFEIADLTAYPQRLSLIHISEPTRQAEI